MGGHLRVGALAALGLLLATCSGPRTRRVVDGDPAPAGDVARDATTNAPPPAPRGTWEEVHASTIRAGEIRAIEVRTREIHCLDIKVTEGVCPVPKDTGLDVLDQETIETPSLWASVIEADVIWADEIHATVVLEDGTKLRSRRP